MLKKKSGRNVLQKLFSATRAPIRSLDGYLQQHDDGNRISLSSENALTLDRDGNFKGSAENIGKSWYVGILSHC